MSTLSCGPTSKIVGHLIDWYGDQVKALDMKWTFMVGLVRIWKYLIKIEIYFMFLNVLLVYSKFGYIENITILYFNI